MGDQQLVNQYERRKDKKMGREMAEKENVRFNLSQVEDREGKQRVSSD